MLAYGPLQRKLPFQHPESGASISDFWSWRVSDYFHIDQRYLPTLPLGPYLGLKGSLLTFVCRRQNDRIPKEERTGEMFGRQTEKSLIEIQVRMSR